VNMRLGGFPRVWRWVRIPVAVMMTLSLCIMCVGQRALYDPGFQTCLSRTISPERGNFRAVYLAKFRWPWGGGEEETDLVVLRGVNGRGDDTEIFVYVPVGNEPHTPVVVWFSPTELSITLDAVGHIYSQKAEACGVRITYRIGKVVHPFGKLDSAIDDRLY